MKEERHRAILRIVREVDVKTQEQLADELRREGYTVTQATVSRDVRELGLLKVAAKEGEYRYAVPPDLVPADSLGQVERTFRQYVRDVAFSGHLLLVKTLPGSASVVAATLDDLGLDSIVGTVAGDDVVLVVVKDGRDSPAPGAATELYDQFLAWSQESPTSSGG